MKMLDKAHVSEVAGVDLKLQRGASLLEAIAYLGIAAIVVIGAVALLSGAFNSANSNQLAEQVSALQTGIKKLYMGQTGGYTGLSNTVLQNSGVLPSTLLPGGGGAITDEWGGAVTIAGTATNFSLTFAAVPQSVCVNTVTAGGTWTTVTINGGAAITAFPITPATASTQCNSASANTIVWTST